MGQWEMRIILSMLFSVPIGGNQKLTDLGFSFKGEVREPFPKVIEVCFRNEIRLIVFRRPLLRLPSRYWRWIYPHLGM